MQKIYRYYKRLVVLGAGPAGLAALSEAAKVGVECVLIDFNNYGVASVDLKQIADLQPDWESPISRFGGTAKFWGNQIAYLSSQDKRNWIEIGNVKDDFFDVIDFELEQFLLQNLKCKTAPLKLFQRQKIDQDIYQTQTYYPRNNSIVDQLKVKKLLSKTKLIEKEVSELVMEGDRVCSVRFRDNSQIIIDAHDAVIVALGCIESTKLLVKSQMNSETNRKIFFGGLVDHPAGNVLKFQLPRFSKRVPRKHRTRRHKNLFEVIEKNHRLFRTARFEIKLEEEAIPFSVALKEFIFDLRISRIKVLIRYLLRRLLPYFIYCRVMKCNYLLWVQIEQMPDPNIGVTFGKSEMQTNWKITDEDKTFVLRTSDRMQKYIEERFSPSKIMLTVSQNTIERELRHAFHPSSLMSSNVNLTTNCLQADVAGKIQGLENCRVISSAIFPTSGWFNPTLLITLLSRMITRNLLAKGYYKDNAEC